MHLCSVMVFNLILFSHTQISPYNQLFNCMFCVITSWFSTTRQFCFYINGGCSFTVILNVFFLFTICKLQCHQITTKWQHVTISYPIWRFKISDCDKSQTVTQIELYHLKKTVLKRKCPWFFIFPCSVITTGTVDRFWPFKKKSYLKLFAH